MNKRASNNSFSLDSLLGIAPITEEASKDYIQQSDHSRRFSESASLNIKMDYRLSSNEIQEDSANTPNRTIYYSPLKKKQEKELRKLLKVEEFIKNENQLNAWKQDSEKKAQKQSIDLENLTIEQAMQTEENNNLNSTQFILTPLESKQQTRNLQSMDELNKVLQISAQNQKQSPTYEHKEKKINFVKIKRNKKTVSNQKFQEEILVKGQKISSKATPQDKTEINSPQIKETKQMSQNQKSYNYSPNQIEKTPDFILIGKKEINQKQAHFRNYQLLNQQKKDFDEHFIQLANMALNIQTLNIKQENDLSNQSQNSRQSSQIKS